MKRKDFKLRIILSLFLLLKQLLKRGINGLYIYASNDKLREKLMTIQKENNNE